MIRLAELWNCTRRPDCRTAISGDLEPVPGRKANNRRVPADRPACAITGVCGFIQEGCQYRLGGSATVHGTVAEQVTMA